MTPVQGTGRPQSGYYAEDEGKVPSVTTITGRFGDKNGIIAKAKILWHAAGLRGEPFDREKFWGGALEVGSLVHQAIEAQVHGQEQPWVPDEVAPRVFSALAAWENWMDDTRLTIEATEVPLVSERYRYGGTIDVVARDARDRLTIVDWKSSKGIYEDYLWQLAAYGQLWNENNDEQITGGFRIVRISKEHGDLEFRHYPELDDALATFLLLREAYEKTQSVKRRAA